MICNVLSDLTALKEQSQANNQTWVGSSGHTAVLSEPREKQDALMEHQNAVTCCAVHPFPVKGCVSVCVWVSVCVCVCVYSSSTRLSSNMSAGDGVHRRRLPPTKPLLLLQCKRTCKMVHLGNVTPVDDHHFICRFACLLHFEP